MSRLVNPSSLRNLPWFRACVFEKKEGGMIKSFTRFIGVAIIALALGSVAKAETFTAYLTSVQEVPPTGSTATAYARMFVNETAGTVSWTVVFNNLSSAQ